MDTLRKNRILSTVSFSLFSGYQLSFVYEGAVFYSLMEHFDIAATGSVLGGILAVCAGLFTAGYSKNARRSMMLFQGICLAGSVPFFFALPITVWAAALAVCGFACGGCVGCWGWFLKEYAPRPKRLAVCAQILIFSGLLALALNLVAVHVSPFAGLGCGMLCLAAALVMVWKLPAGEAPPKSVPAVSLRKPMTLLCCFILIITINSGLMFQVFNPAFSEHAALTGWYVMVPFVAFIALMWFLVGRVKQNIFLYGAMVMHILSFIMFMVLGRSTADYLIVSTLILGACGIFDLFWWHALAEMLDYSINPVRIWSIGLGTNVLGVLLGGGLGTLLTGSGAPAAYVAVIALAVLVVTLMILPYLHAQLEHFLNHEPAAPVILSKREQQVLELILKCKPNAAIAEALFISESTVKTHVKNIFAKYGAASRAELISKALNGGIK